MSALLPEHAQALRVALDKLLRRHRRRMARERRLVAPTVPRRAGRS